MYHYYYKEGDVYVPERDENGKLCVYKDKCYKYLFVNDKKVEDENHRAIFQDGFYVPIDKTYASSFFIMENGNDEINDFYDLIKSKFNNIITTHKMVMYSDYCYIGIKDSALCILLLTDLFEVEKIVIHLTDDNLKTLIRELVK